jgi:hypothetical protein
VGLAQGASSGDADKSPSADRTQSNKDSICAAAAFFGLRFCTTLATTARDESQTSRNNPKFVTSEKGFNLALLLHLG